MRDQRTKGRGRAMHRAVILAALVLAVPAPAVLAAQAGGGSGSQGFSCDVNTMKCTCKGDFFGADCKAMLKNCLPYPTKVDCNPPISCTCRMAIEAPPPSPSPTLSPSPGLTPVPGPGRR